MGTKEVLTELRKGSGLTQDALAERLFVTRQAVSRWETGETTPNTETLKLISREFDVSINTLLGQPQEPICQSCAMPLREIDDLGTEADSGVSTEFCVHCYQDGSFTHNHSLDQMVESNLRFLSEFNAQNGLNFSEDEARTVLKLHLATLKRWKDN
ncbi:MAG: helix-turn-helix domain-containing protein [Coriobacteriia bacterium]|nr:helix-turn-helix domain-containing protein [Coriobacteriia bacterium]